MRKIFFIAWLLFPLSLTAQDTYYYYKGEKIYLTIDQNNINILPDKECVKSSISKLNELNLKTDMKIEEIKDGEIIKLSIQSGRQKKQEYSEIVKQLKSDPSIKKVFPFVGNTESRGTSDIFYLKLKEMKDTLLLKQVSEDLNVQIIKQVTCMPNWYILSIQNSEFNNTIEASNYFYEKGYFEDIDPAFMFDFTPSCTNDPMFSQLWGLSNNTFGIDINVCEAWNISKGNGVKVAVVDQGIYMGHHDLSENIFSEGFDTRSGTSPSVFIPGFYHGTHVAGTIAAVANNNLQIVGVAPEAQIIGVSNDLMIHSAVVAELVSGISWAWQNGADIITNSWGDYGGKYWQLHSTLLEEAIIDAMTKGRNGKGCVVLFSAGNENDMDYPANFDERILTVGSISSNGTLGRNSAVGDELDVVAPGVGILSTMPFNEVASKSGTSMATPHVAGVAALVLSTNTNLTRKQVADIIESTSQKVMPDLYTYQPTPNRLNGSWSNEVGYGLIDAYAAILATCTPTNLINQTITTNTAITGCVVNVKNVDVQNNAKLTLDANWTTTIEGPFKVYLGSQLEVK